ncbi:Uncharacterised protein [Bordetella pertussis]|nr:Uncharacterised protein [Bordetella pertussis]
MVDWRPKLEPPPMRRASASNDAPTIAVPATATSAMAQNREKRDRDMLLCSSRTRRHSPAGAAGKAPVGACAANLTGN